jgi:hypothetical protein
MEIDVQLDGLDATERNIFALQDWLKQYSAPHQDRSPWNGVHCG